MQNQRDTADFERYFDVCADGTIVTVRVKPGQDANEICRETAIRIAGTDEFATWSDIYGELD